MNNNSIIPHAMTWPGLKMGFFYNFANVMKLLFQNVLPRYYQWECELPLSENLCLWRSILTGKPIRKCHFRDNSKGYPM